MIRHTLAALCAMILLAGPTAAAESEAEADARRDQARPIALEGLELFESERYREAIAALERAEALFHAPTHLLYIARARRALGERIEAHETYVAIILEEVPNYAPEPFHQAQRDAAREAAALEAELATVRIRTVGVPPADVTVRLDGAAIPEPRLAQPIAVAPGRHEVVAEAANAAPARRVVRAVEGKQEQVALTLEPLAAPTPAPTGEEAQFPVLGTAILALGGAALVAGGVTGGITLSRAKDIKDRCDGDVCPRDQEQRTEDAKIIGHASTGLFVAGGVLAAAGVVLLVVDPFDGGDEESAGPVALELRPGGAFLTGRF